VKIPKEGRRPQHGPVKHYRERRGERGPGKSHRFARMAEKDRATAEWMRSILRADDDKNSEGAPKGPPAGPQTQVANPAGKRSLPVNPAAGVELEATSEPVCGFAPASGAHGRSF
jgi:hypothetical protein